MIGFIVLAVLILYIIAIEARFNNILNRLRDEREARRQNEERLTKRINDYRDQLYKIEHRHDLLVYILGFEWKEAPRSGTYQKMYDEVK